MRFLALALTLAFSVSSTAFAEEPNLKVTKDSGGKSTSSLILDAPLKSDYVMGSEKAPVVMVEYASLSCPHCAHFSNTVLPDLQKKYIETGKIRYVLRQFPLNEPALKGTMLVECVGEQSTEKYFLFSKVLFDAQNKWAFDGNFLSGLESIAMVGGLTKEQFGGCINHTDREVKVLNAKKQAMDELKIPHTPYIFIAGEVYSGNLSVDDISAFIDAKLAQKTKP
jgi:protein-disulfide isomerase